MPTWLITGCSTGFGRQLALDVLARGWQAAITARNPADIADIAGRYPQTCLPLQLDLRDGKGICAAAKAAIERFDVIDVLVNNAGYGYRAAIEEGEDEEIRALFETNVFGLVAMTRAVLPGMRARRQGAIVNLSSVAGLIGQAGTGFYAASKFAVEGLSESLSKEVGPLGIQVLLVEPGPFRTDFAGRSLRQSREALPDYAGTAGIRRKENSALDGNQPGDPVRAVHAIIEALQSKNPPFRLVLGRGAADRVAEALQHQLAELASWRDVAVNADFPD